MLSEAEELELLELEEQEYQESQKPSVSKGTSAVRGAAQGVTMGLADEALGAIGVPVQKAMDAFTGNKLNENATLKELYQRLRDDERLKDKTAKEANPKTYMGGEFAGGMASTVIPGTQGNTAAKLAALGGIQGLGNSTADLTEGDVTGAAIDTGIGGTLGVAAGKGLPAAAKGAGWVGDKLGINKVAGWLGKKAAKAPDALERFAEERSAKAMGATKGTIKKIGEDKIREIGRGGLDEGIVTPFATTKTMTKRAQDLMKKGGENMDQAYSAIDDAGASTFNPLNVASKVDDELGGFYRSPINRGETAQLENTIESILMRGGDNIPLKEAQLLKREIGKVAYPAGRKVNPAIVTEKQRMAQEAYRIINKSIDESAEKASKTIGDDAIAATLKTGKKQYGIGAGAEDLLDEKSSSELGNKFVGLTDWGLGGGGLAASLITANPAGIALTAGAIGAKKLGEKFGNNVMATGADATAKGARWLGDKIPDLIKSNPQIMGKYAPAFQNAMLKGAQQVGLTHWLLMNNDPEYRQMLDGIEKQGEPQ